jgi:colicin import membrane protein
MPRKSPTARNKGIVTSALIHVVLIVILMLAGFSVSQQPQDTSEGIVVNFGTGDTGEGLIEPSPPAFREELPPPPPARVISKKAEEPMMTQDNEESPKVKKADPEAEKRKLDKIEADRKAKADLDAERLKRQVEEKEQRRKEAEQQRQTDIINRTKNALAGSKNAGTSSTGEGIAGGPGNQGVPSGSVDSKVRGEGGSLGNGTKGTISYDLQGRGVQSLPSPKYDYQGEGRVVVEITVDRSGKVIQALPGVKGSTTLDDYFLKVAKAAALEARFEVKNDAPEVQKGENYL